MARGLLIIPLILLFYGLTRYLDKGSVLMNRGKSILLVGILTFLSVAFLCSPAFGEATEITEMTAESKLALDMSTLDPRVEYCLGIAGCIPGLFHAGWVRHGGGWVYPGQEHLQYPYKELSGFLHGVFRLFRDWLCFDVWYR